MTGERDVVEERTRKALEESGRPDPRVFCRGRLRTLKEQDPDGYRQAISHFERVLIPAVVVDGADPLEEWVEYSRILVALSSEGRTVQIDGSGLALPYARPASPDHLILHLPASSRDPAIEISRPLRLSAAQSAAYDLLVSRKVS